MARLSDSGLKLTLAQKHSPLILVADDDPVLRQVLCRAIKLEGYRAIEASNGEDCLKAFKQFQPNLVLLDCIMPGMDGFTCCQELSAISSSTPILMMTSLDSAESVDHAFELGATDYLTKPIQWAVLRHRVHRLLQTQETIANAKHRVEQEQSIRASAQRIHQFLNLEEILTAAVADVRHFLHTERVLVYRFNSDGGGTIAAESVVNGEFSIIDQQFHDVCLQACLPPYQQGRIRVLEDIRSANLHPCYANLLSQLKVKASLVMPLLQRDKLQSSKGQNNKLWGLLITHHCSAPRQWQTVEIELVEYLVAQVMIAIQQAEVHQQEQHLIDKLERRLRRRTAQLRQARKLETTLRRITNQVRDSLDDSLILSTAIQELALSLNAQSAYIAFYDFNRRVSTVHFEYTAATASVQGQVISLDQLPSVYQALSWGQSLQFCLISPSVHPAAEHAAILACPLVDDKSVIGDLWLFKSQEDCFNDLEVRLVQQVATQCVVALRQSRLHQAARKQVEELDRLNHLKDNFLGAVSHELRSPLSNIRTAIQVLKRTLPKAWSVDKQDPTLDPDCTRSLAYLKILHDECEREIHLVNDLLDLQRMESGYQSSTLDPISLQKWIPSVVEPFFQQAEERSQTIEVNLPPDLPLIYSNLANLERILTELLHNACKHSPPQEKITLSARIVQTRTLPKDQQKLDSLSSLTASTHPLALQPVPSLQLTVSNSGIEIPAAEFSRIFEKFYRIPQADPWRERGTGLGLALVKHLVKNLRGSIRVESAAGQTCFTVELPLS